MELPGKRSNPNESLIKNPQKRLKIPSNEISSQSFAVCLRKDLWIEIIDFLDTKSYFLIIPRVNSFFYSIVKECKNYRTTLSLTLIVDNSLFYNTNRCTISNKYNCMEYILNSKSLQKLELKLRTWVIPIEENEPSLTFSDHFILMKSLNILKILKIHVGMIPLIQFENLLTLFRNLEVLIVSFDSNYPFGFSFIQNNYIKKSENYSHKFHLKKLSLIYRDIAPMQQGIGEILESLDKSISLEKFSFKVIEMPSRKLEIHSFLKTNFYLKCIKLPSSFFFNDTSAEELCKYLARSETLEELQISDSVMINSSQFINAILINRSLKILILKPSVFNQNLKFKIKIDDTFELFNALANSLIEEFSMSIFIDNTIKKVFECWPLYIINSIEKFLECFDNFISVSKKIRKITISIEILPTKYKILLVDLILKHAKLGKIEYFAGYNLKMLMENKIEILELGKKDKLFVESHYMESIIGEIFRRLLTNADKILRVTKYNDPRTIIDVDKFIKSVTESKALVLKQNILSKALGMLSLLYYYLMIILSTRIREIRILDIRNISIDPFHDLFPELLKEFKSLEKLKFNFISKNRLVIDFSNIFKAISASLKNVIYISFTCESTPFKSCEEVFLGLTDYEPLRKFKFKNCICAIINYAPNSNLDNFISRSKIISLNLSGTTFDYYQLIELAKGLERNRTITHLKLEKIGYMIPQGVMMKTEIKRKIEVFLKILSALKLKNYKKISLFYSGKIIYENSVEDKHYKQYLIIITDILCNNLNLKEFNVRMEFPNQFLYSYSEIILKAIEKNKGLKIINFFDIKEIFSNDEKAISFARDYYKKISLGLYTAYINKFILNAEFYKFMQIVFSELIKKCQTSHLNKFVDWVFQSVNICNSKTFCLENKNKERSMSFKYNLLDTFTCLENLMIFDYHITFTDIEVIVKNLIKLEFLKTIILKINRCSVSDLYQFLVPKNITCLKSYSNSLNIENIAKLSEKIKSSRLQKLVLKNIIILYDFQVNMDFHKFIEAIICPYLRVLKIYIKYTHELLDILIQKLNGFKNLEYLCVSISENYHDFQGPIKKLITLLKSNKTLISKVKVHKYSWDIGKLKVKVKNFYEFQRCALSPADLMFFAELCEGNIVKKVSCVDFSENKKIIDINFTENIAKIIRALGCNRVVVRKIGCEKEHVRQIKDLLGSEKGSLVNFILDN
ncbi:hypothetical protein SteCoe_38111 [Stentor coeruleus]|uniref:Uncharacterized protein n=1 Tax=Stentor coeruleus TaxID=5963 RepID=A0A1R2AM45_9CILI|nr:hypothetical protein SteCoe_38111 [Stentor coeruleus]